MTRSNETPKKILVISSDSETATQVGSAVANSKVGSFEVEWLRDLSGGLERLAKSGIAVVLLDLIVSGGRIMEAFDKLFAFAPQIPILIIGEQSNEKLAIEVFERGAQDYLLRDHLDSYFLPRVLRNAIERKIVEDALNIERDRALVTLNSIGDAVLCTDISGRVTYLNAVAEAITGWTREEANGQPVADVFRIIDGSTRATAPDPLGIAVGEDRAVGVTANCILIRRDGIEFAIEDSAAPIHDQAGKVIGAVIVFHDVSVARAMTLEMTHAAQHDLVTNLPNRLLLDDRISQEIGVARRHNRPIAVIFLDLDHFKYINDSLGHAAGDLLLQSVAKRLIGCLRSSDTVSRHGGDEFVILLSEIVEPEDASASAERILLAINRPHSVANQDLHVGASVGISIFPNDGEDAKSLIRAADLAMYHAKEDGRNCFRFFEPRMNLKLVERQSIETSLRHALDRNEFRLHYQPKVNFETGKIRGVEALIRWEQPGEGLIPPAQFIPIAEDCGLIVEIGRWVMHEACRQLQAWHSGGFLPVPIAVNVSAIEFRHKDFVEGVRKNLRETGLPALFLELELTEGVLMKDVESTATVLQELKAMGVHLAVDDFGTGFSSLSYLRQFPIDTLKIDRSFIHQLTVGSDDSTIVSAIINLGLSLKYLVVAEGIETQMQRDQLYMLHCEEGQGYFFSKPLPAERFADLLQADISFEV